MVLRISSGLPGALLTTAGQTAGIIPDGVHTHPAIVALAWQMKGPKRLNVVTDAMAALGMPPGRYMLGDQEVTVTELDARLPRRQTCLVSATNAGALVLLPTPTLSY